MWFALVIVAIPLVLWMVKQSPLGRLHGLKPQAGDCPMKPLSSLSLSPSQKLVTIEVGSGAHRRWLVLGVTPGSITALHQIDPVTADQGLDARRHPAERHTRDDRSLTDSVATQPMPLDLHPGYSTNPAPVPNSAAVLPFAQLLSRLRGQPSEPRHG